MTINTVIKNDNNKQGFIMRALNGIERVGNALPDPTTIFILLAFAVIIASFICQKLNVKVVYETFDTAKNAFVKKEVGVVNLISADGLRYIVTSAVRNFTNFVALGTVFAVILGVGVAEGTGFMTAVLKKLAKVTPAKLVTPMIVFLGVMSNVASSVGYVVFIPLAGILYKSLGRHPIVGIAAAFAGVSGGWNANLLLGTNDPVFAAMSTQAAKLINPAYNVLPTGNWFFMFISTFVITIIGTLVTEKIIEPRFGSYKDDEETVVNDITSAEKRGMKFALWGMLAYIAIILILILPPGAILRDPATGEIMKSPFMSGIVFIMMLFFLIPGLMYGIGARVIKNDKDVINLMTNAISKISGFLVLVFFAAQFIEYFNYTNLGVIISVSGANFLKSIGFVGLPLIVTFILVTTFINIFIAVDTAKWAIMAPIFVPMFMRLGLSPELTQVAYRIGDSCTNIIAPLMPFFPYIVSLCKKYDKNSGMGTLISTMLPYTIAFLIGWIILLVIWYILGLPIGPGAPLFYKV